MSLLSFEQGGEWEPSPSREQVEAERVRFLAEQDARLASRAKVAKARAKVNATLAAMRA